MEMSQLILVIKSFYNYFKYGLYVGAVINYSNGVKQLGQDLPNIDLGKGVPFTVINHPIMGIYPKLTYTIPYILSNFIILAIVQINIYITHILYFFEKHFGIKVMKETSWSSIEEGITEFNETYYNDLEPQYKQLIQEWNAYNPLSDEHLILMLTQGNGSLLLKKEGNQYSFDSLHLQKYEPKSGYERIGSKINLNRDINGKITIDSIQDSYGIHRPNDGFDYQRSKLFVKCGILNEITIKHHLIYTHFLSAKVFIATKELPAKHVLRKLLEPFIYYEDDATQLAINTLVNEGNLFHLWSGLTRESYLTMMKDFVSLYKIETPEEFDSELNWLPFNQDATLLWNTIKTFVGSYINNYYPTEQSLINDLSIATWLLKRHVNGTLTLNKSNLIKIVSYHIYMGSAYHNYTSNFFGINYHPLNCVNGVRKSNGTNILNITGSREITRTIWTILNATSLKTVTLNTDFSFLYEDLEIKSFFSNFSKSLQNVSKTIQERNKTRQISTISFDPSFIGTSACY
jgi:hypothetical protein